MNEDAINHIQLDFDIQEYAIGGKLVVGGATISEELSVMMFNDDAMMTGVKRKMVNDMVDFILDNKLIEFTSYTDPASYNKILKIRAYLAPDNQVKIIRSVSKV